MKTSIFRLPLIAFVVLGSVCCQPEDTAPPGYQTMDFDNFQLEASNEWQEFSQQGIDSYVGGLTNGKDSLFFDYGWYSYSFADETSATHVRQETEIDSLPALLVRPRHKGKGVIGVYIEIDAQMRLSIYGQNIRNEDAIIRMFRSIRF